MLGVLTTIVSGALTIGTYAVGFALIYALWRDVASPLTIFLLTWATAGVLVDRLLVPDRRLEPVEGLGIGAATAVGLGMVSVSGLLKKFPGGT